jgi:hypothetical protein
MSLGACCLLRRPIVQLLWDGTMDVSPLLPFSNTFQVLNILTCYASCLVFCKNPTCQFDVPRNSDDAATYECKSFKNGVWALVVCV